MTTETATNLRGDPDYYRGLSWRLFQSSIHECSHPRGDKKGLLDELQIITLISFLGTMLGSHGKPKDFLLFDDEETKSKHAYQEGIIELINIVTAFIKEKGYKDDDEANYL